MMNGYPISRYEERFPPARLVAQVDNSQIMIAPGRVWTTQVLGLHVFSNGEAWLQVALIGEHSHSLVLHLSAHTTADNVLDTLEAWLRSPNDQLHTIHIMHPS